MDDEINNIEDWMDFGIGDSVDDTGRLRDEGPAERSSVGILHAVYPRHPVYACAQCYKRISEIQMAYTRNDRLMFCDPVCDKHYRRKHGGA